PEITYIPDRMGSLARQLTAKAGGLADVSAALIQALFDQGADVHLAIPDYRSIFQNQLAPFLKRELNYLRQVMPDDRVHLAQDRAFYYLNRVYSYSGGENLKLAITFQREVINNILPWVRPDLIHCNDWMTGLIPAMARQLEIPCLFTIHNIHTVKALLSQIEDRGIDAAYFWHHLFYTELSPEYEQARDTAPVDFLVSGVFAAHFVNTVSPTFLQEIVEGRHPFIDDNLRRELTNKAEAECAFGILNAPDPAFDPENDSNLVQRFGPDNHVQGKKANKQYCQQILGLIENEAAPLFFWPSRLDPVQKGCQLLSHVLYRIISTWWERQLQIVFVAGGDYQNIFKDIVSFHGFEKRVAVCDFEERLEHLGYAASDFILMPSKFEPCGLPQMIAPLYGSLPVAFDTGGIHDTIADLDLDAETGNGFLFDFFDSEALFWAVTRAVHFFEQPEAVKARHRGRIMRQSRKRFNHSVTASQYIDLYEKMLKRPLINKKPI
ncbi:MAG: glycogen/starch synthase, partial [Desulfohalobiaceae bacterium]|nr:glycogen/starch synthase [Desulfohalobiaceae bacterium]